uniref:RE1-silencing transcription factor n=1 Tax=Cacopsylla melanoneura TaxID=428564 RepID=A0A8D8WU29_9HEMI
MGFVAQNSQDIHTCVHCMSFASSNVNALIQHGKKCTSVYRPDPYKFKFACFACNHFSYHKGNIVSHTRKHLGDKPFKCHLCEYQSIQKVCLKIHLKNKHSLEMQEIRKKF